MMDWVHERIDRRFSCKRIAMLIRFRLGSIGTIQREVGATGGISSSSIDELIGEELDRRTNLSLITMMNVSMKIVFLVKIKDTLLDESPLVSLHANTQRSNEIQKYRRKVRGTHLRVRVCHSSTFDHRSITFSVDLSFFSRCPLLNLSSTREVLLHDLATTFV